MRGAYIELRHRASCPLARKGRKEQVNSRRCRCDPEARARIQGVWVLKARLPVGWTRGTTSQPGALLAFEQEVQHEWEAISAGEKIAEAPKRAPTVAAWAKACIEDIREGIDDGQDDAYSPRTLASHESISRNYLEPTRAQGGLGDLPLTSVTVDVIREHRRLLIDELGKSPGYAKQVTWTLSGMLEAAAGLGIIDTNPARVERRGSYGRRPKKTQRKAAPKTMHLDTARRLLEVTWPTTLGQMILWGLTGGLRDGELRGTRVENFNLAARRYDLQTQLDHGEDRPPKYESYRTLPVYSRLAQLWAPHDGGEGYLFLNENTGLPFSADVSRMRLHEAWDRVAVRPERYGWHTLRHTFRNALDRAGLRPALIDSVMGHAKTGIAGVYTWVEDHELDAIEDAVEREFGRALAPVSVPPSVEVAAEADARRS